MSYSKVITTHQGENYLKNKILNNQPLVFTKIATSVDKLSTDTAKDVEQLENIQQSVQASHHERLDEETVRIEAQLTNDNMGSAYHIQTIGIYVQGDEIKPEPVYETDEDGEVVKDEEGNPIEVEPEPVLDEEGNEITQETQYEEILYGVAVAEEPFYMASPSKNQISLTIGLTVYVGEVDEINLTVDPAGGATQRDLQNVIQLIKQIELDTSIATALTVGEITGLLSQIDNKQTVEQAKMSAELLEINMSLV